MRGKKYLSKILLETFGLSRITMTIPSGDRRGGGKRLNQVSVKFEEEFYDRLKRACEIQQHRDGQLVRILVEWSLPYYEAARSVEALTAILAPPKRPKKKSRRK